MASAIRVLLQENVENLGTTGEVVRVRPGFARNFLIPRGLAVPATSGNLARADELKRLYALRADQALAAAQQKAEQIAGISVKLERVVGAEAKMYGSVTARDIAEAFAARGVELDKRKIELKDSIKELGNFEVPIKLHPSVTASLKIEVAKKGG
jgi:large subunit ribosomal protein L9